MSIIQKKVDIIVEEGEDISKYGSSVTGSHYNYYINIPLKQENSKYIYTTTDEILANSRGEKSTIRHFTSAKMKEIFGVDTSSRFFINFATREVINITGVQIGGETFFVLNGLHEALEGND